MSMTLDAQAYFDKVAPEWDRLRSQFFTEAVREAAIKKAYLHSQMVIADVGAGAGFMTAGLAPLVSHVHAVDGSAAMLEAARKNLVGYPNVSFHEADGLSLPFADASLDAVFANMYLHHCPDPLAAIREMARVLRPAGRLVITDMDTHRYAWLKDEMADVWMGFERSQVRAWFKEADLVNIVVDCTGESCCTESQDSAVDENDQKAVISIFVASGTRRVQGAQAAVQAEYSAHAEGIAACGCNTEPVADNACCGPTTISLDEISETSMNWAAGYSPSEQAGVPLDAVELSLGCGNPTALANLKPGESVLDIGSGGGIDVFLAARQVGPTGRVIGVDMTPAMLERARRSAQKAGLNQVEFRQGFAENLPVDDASIDVILSNCVINLTEDKGKVFQEAWRVLKPGGRLEISDTVFAGPIPAGLRESLDQWAGCITGALPEAEYLDLIAQAGFKNITRRRSASAGVFDNVPIYSIIVSAHK